MIAGSCARVGTYIILGLSRLLALFPTSIPHFKSPPLPKHTLPCPQRPPLIRRRHPSHLTHIPLSYLSQATHSNTTTMGSSKTTNESGYTVTAVNAVWDKLSSYCASDATGTPDASSWWLSSHAEPSSGGDWGSTLSAYAAGAAVAVASAAFFAACSYVSGASALDLEGTPSDEDDDSRKFYNEDRTMRLGRVLPENIPDPDNPGRTVVEIGWQWDADLERKGYLGYDRYDPVWRA